MSGEPSSPRLGRVSTLFRQLVEERGYRVLAEGVHNHGGIQWSAGERDGIGRWIAFALIPGPTKVEQDRQMHAEVWAGADDESRYAPRQLISVFDLDESSLDRESPFAQSFESMFRQALAQGFERAAAFRDADLTESRNQPARRPS
jgi:hypothetical protein